MITNEMIEKWEIDYSTAFAGETIVSVDGLHIGSEKVLLKTQSGYLIKLYHQQDCCEQVELIDIEGTAETLLNTPILSFSIEESNDNQNLEERKKYESHFDDSETWTYYKFATIKGHVDIRWLGTSNGYYSERVDIQISKI